MCQVLGTGSTVGRGAGGGGGEGLGQKPLTLLKFRVRRAWRRDFYLLRFIPLAALLMERSLKMPDGSEAMRCLVPDGMWTPGRVTGAPAEDGMWMDHPPRAHWRKGKVFLNLSHPVTLLRRSAYKQQDNVLWIMDFSLPGRLRATWDETPRTLVFSSLPG